mgnify:CR=1 FL=1
MSRKSSENYILAMAMAESGELNNREAGDDRFPLSQLTCEQYKSIAAVMEMNRAILTRPSAVIAAAQGALAGGANGESVGDTLPEPTRACLMWAAGDHAAASSRCSTRRAYP